MLTKSKILLGLTTTKGSNWKKKIDDINRFELDDIALFLTGIDYKERLEFYKLIEKTNLKKTSHIHLRNDMGIDEVEYLVKKFNPKYLNIHASDKEYPFDKDVVSAFKDLIYIENCRILNNSHREEIDNSAGLCLDISHLEAYFLKNGHEDNNYLEYLNILNDYKIGCSHVSSVKNTLTKRENEDKYGYDFHYFSELSDFDYLKKYEKYFPEFLSLELENDFEEQIKASGYIKNLF